MRIAVLALVAVLGLAAGCKTSEPAAPPKASTYDGEGTPKIKFKSEPAPAADTGTSQTSGPGALDYIAVPFENIVYVPWKIIGGGAKGAADGVSSGFSKDRMPILGLIFSPVNLIVGFATGAVECLVMKPVLLGPTDGFSHAMAQPTRHATAIWWYE